VFQRVATHELATELDPDRNEPAAQTLANPGAEQLVHVRPVFVFEVQLLSNLGTKIVPHHAREQRMPFRRVPFVPNDVTVQIHLLAKQVGCDTALVLLEETTTAKAVADAAFGARFERATVRRTLHANERAVFVTRAQVTVRELDELRGRSKPGELPAVLRVELR
jgi:hypothetical protein